MIRFENVTKTYAGGATKAVDDLNLENRRRQGVWFLWGQTAPVKPRRSK